MILLALANKQDLGWEGEDGSGCLTSDFGQVALEKEQDSDGEGQDVSPWILTVKGPL